MCYSTNLKLLLVQFQRRPQRAPPPAHARASGAGLRHEAARARRGELARAEEVALQTAHHHLRGAPRRHHSLLVREALAAAFGHVD